MQGSDVRLGKPVSPADSIPSVPKVAHQHQDTICTGVLHGCSGVKLHMQHARQRLSALAAKLGWQYNELGSWEANKVNYMVAVNKVIF
jgi:hypothetical protein